MSDIAARRAALKEHFLRTPHAELPPRELLELLLSYAEPEDRLTGAARDLLTYFDSFSGVLNAGPEELLGLKGLDKSAAALVALAGCLVRRSLNEKAALPVISGPAAAGEYLVPRLLGLEREMMYALCLDEGLRLLSCRAICEGDVSRLKVDTYALLIEAQERDAAALIIAHNHPNGVALPSREDRITTDSLSRFLTGYGVTLIDHLVVAGYDFVSMASERPLAPPDSPLLAQYKTDPNVVRFRQPKY